MTEVSSPRRVLYVAALAFGLTGTAWAQAAATPEPTATATATATPTPKPPAPTPMAPQPVMPAFKLPIRELNLSAEVRHRYEYWKDFDFNQANKDTDDVVGQRIRLGLEFVPTDSLKGFIQVQDARAFGNASIYPGNGVPVPTAGTGNNTLASQGASTDIHQAYFLASHKKTGLSVQIGRQEWLYANQKVIGPVGWSNVGRAFDGVRVRHDKKFATTDLLWSRISEGGRTRGTPAAAVVDWVDADFYGIYSTIKLVKSHPFDLYWLGLGDDEITGLEGKTGNTRFNTLGFQLSKIQGKDVQIEYGTELNYQFGRRAGADHTAYAIHGRLGIGSPKWPLQAKLLYQYDLASGDSNRADGESETFQQLFPTVHLWHGYLDLVARQNVQDHWVALYTVPKKDWRLGFHFHALSAAEGTDALYRASGAVIRVPAAGRSGGTDFGKEIDVILDKKMNANWALQAGVGQFFSGTYLANVPPTGSTAATGPADDVTYFYFQSTVAF